MSAENEEKSPHVELARKTIESYVRDGLVENVDEAPSELKGKRAGAFVCLKKGGNLRGCIGTIEPVAGNLAEEIRNNAISSATRDPRFMPVSPEELYELEYSVDILEEPEDVPDISYLDPKEYGVIVEAGGRSGLLLPDLEGIDTPEEQVRIASMKAGIKPGEHVKLKRFKVTRHE